MICFSVTDTHVGGRYLQENVSIYDVVYSEELKMLVPDMKKG